MRIQSVDKFILSVIVTLSGVAANAQRRPGPPPPPPPVNGPGAGRGQILGEIRTITDDGEVFGWACATDVRAPLELAVYVNGNKDRRLNPEASLNARDDRRMGVPARACGEYSGFRFQLSREQFDGSMMQVEIRTGGRFSRTEYGIAQTTFRTPADRLRETLFTVNTRTYYSNGQDAFCYITNPDQLKLFNRSGRLGHVQLRDLPRNMRNDGNCALQPFPKAIFFTRESGGTGWYSDGRTYCGLPFPGMLVHIAEVNRISTNADQYDNLPGSAMQNTGVCKVEGLFQVGQDIFYSNGQNAFCRLTHPSFVAGRPVYPYEGFPPQMANHGDCQR